MRLFLLFLLGVLTYAVALPQASAEPGVTGQRVTLPRSSRLFEHRYTIYDHDFCGTEVCVDFDNDGQNDLLYASRATGALQLLNASDGSIRWSRQLAGRQQSTSAFDIDGDGRFEILYSVSSPGTLYLLDGLGNVLKKYDSGDDKLGNSAVILDADRDGTLEAYFGTRSKYLVRLNVADFTHIHRRPDWVQCGCYTSAIDVDRSGRWALFAGSGDDHFSKGVLHRLDPLTLKSTWSFSTNDNASSADAVLADIDGDGQVEVIKSVDNYNRDDEHDAVYAFKADGRLLWKVAGLSGEDSPNVADLDHDGQVEIIGMTFGGEVYCLDSQGRFKWRRDLRPDLDDATHMYMTPILCDLNGDAELEILAMTHDRYFSLPKIKSDGYAHAKLFALNARGEVLDELDLGEPRYWGHAFVCQLDKDPHLSLVVSGSGGLDVIRTQGIGPNLEHFQRRRSYQRLNVVPWSYHDSYFIHRGDRRSVANLTDNLILAKSSTGYPLTGNFTTQLCTLPRGFGFTGLELEAETPKGTSMNVEILDAAGQVVRTNLTSRCKLNLVDNVQLRFTLSTTSPMITPKLDSYSLQFDRLHVPPGEGGRK